MAYDQAAGILGVRRALRQLRDSTDALVAALTECGQVREFGGDDRFLPPRLPRRAAPVPSAERKQLRDGTTVTVAHRRVRGLQRTFGVVVVEPDLDLPTVFRSLDAAIEPIEEILVVQLEW